MINTPDLPLIIKTAIVVALQHFPSLCDTDIEFRLIDGYSDKVMAAQPKPWSLLGPRSDRKYVIKISSSINLGEGEPIAIEEIPEDVLIGWIGHELGHIVDYESRDLIGMMSFGFGYLFSSRSKKEAEYAADTYAIINGLSNYILSTKDFILNNASIPETYKIKIRRNYMSPEVVYEKVQALEAEAKIN